MPIIVFLAVLVAIGTLTAGRRRTGGDTPAWIAAAATNRLAVHRREWARAMAAELAHVRGRARRWRFAAGMLRVLAFPPATDPRRVLFVVAGGVVVGVAATAVAARAVPSLSVFIGVLSALLAVYAATNTAHGRRPRRSAAQATAGTVALAGLAATIAAVVAVAVAHPAATVDHTHEVLSVLFALLLIGYLAAASASPRPAPHAAVWWALAGTGAAAAFWIATAATTVGAAGVSGLVSPVGAAAALTASIGAAATARDHAAGVRAGVLTAVLTAPIQFAVTVISLLRIHTWTLTDPYDITAYPRSGYPDVASYLLSDYLGGNIIAGLMGYPVVLLAATALGASIGIRLRRVVESVAAR